MTLAIELEAVDKSYGDHRVLRGLELRVPERSVFAFLGNNGHGKSTTIRLIAGLANADSGCIRVLGRDIRRDRRRILAEMGCLVEAPSSYPNLTGIEFLSIATSLKGVGRSEIDRVLELVGLSLDRRQRIEHYSLGMKQRLALAHALIGNPRLLLLDEPTNGLDPDGIRDIRHLLSTLPDQAGCTVFFASHLLDEVEKTATHLAVLRQGSCLLQAAVREISGTLASVLEVEVDDIEKATTLVRSLGYDQIDVDARHLSIHGATRDDAGRIHAALVESGVVLFQSTHRKPSLEHWFLQTVLSGRGAA